MKHSADTECTGGVLSHVLSHERAPQAAPGAVSLNGRDVACVGEHGFPHQPEENGKA